MNSFENKILGIKARINRFKTLGLSSSSSLAVAEKTITIPFQIIATRITGAGEVMDADSSKIAYVRINTNDNMPALVTLRLISPTSFGDRIIMTAKTLNDSGGARYCYRIAISGDTSDIAALNNGQTLPIINYTFKILTTSAISYSIHYVDTEVHYD